MGTFPQVTSGTESSSGLHEWTGWLQSVSLSTMQVCELLVCINRQVWVEGLGQSMNCVHDICDEAQKHRWPHAPTLNRLCMLCYLIFVKQMAPEIHRPLSGPQGACPSDQREADSFPGPFVFISPRSPATRFTLDTDAATVIPDSVFLLDLMALCPWLGGPRVTPHHLTLCDPIDGSPPGSAIPGILQARTLEWVAISFSNA